MNSNTPPLNYGMRVNDKKHLMPVTTTYEEAFRVISKLRADGVISDTVYEVLWNGVEKERASDQRFRDEMKNRLPQIPKS